MKIPAGLVTKSSGVDGKTALRLVAGALIDAQKTSTPPLLLLKPTGPNWLDQLYRHEVISTLTEILAMHPGLFAIVPNDQLEDVTGEGAVFLTGLHSEKQWWKKWQEAPETAPILLGTSDQFANWCAAETHKRKTTLKTLSEPNRRKVITVMARVSQRFEFTSNPNISIPCFPSDPDGDFESTRLALEFLAIQGVVTSHQFYLTGNGAASIEIDVQEYYRIRDELLAMYPADQDSEKGSEKPAPTPPNPFTQLGDLKWEEITIQFINGHEVRISAQSTRATWGFKEMGFQDGRKRLPNHQWQLLQLLARKSGRVSWENSEAEDNIKKQKQLLSKTLKKFFKIDDDPFLIYQDQKAYRTKFKLKDEGD